MKSKKKSSQSKKYLSPGKRKAFEGEMSSKEFRKYGYRAVDWIADYLDNIEDRPVFPDIKPGDIIKKLPEFPPEKGEPFEKIFEDFKKVILPGTTNWNHPKFLAYFNSSGSKSGIIAEFLTAALNNNAMVWKSGPSSTELERTVMSWLREIIGLPGNFWGIIYDTASISTLHAIASAREEASAEVRKKGLTGLKNIGGLRLYCSEQAHSSVEKGAVALGIGTEGVRKIPVDQKFKMIPSELSKAIEEDRESGLLPFCVVATIGTTSTTSVDPVDEIAEICSKEKIWLHVDAAHAGITAVLPEMRKHFKGVDKADSFVFNPHKWMFVPVDLSAYYTRKPEILKRAFSLVPEYLKTKEDDSVQNLMDYGIQLGRRMRSLKLWFVIRYFGVEGIASRVREHLRLGKLFTEWIDADSEFERMAPVPFSTICFRLHPKEIKDEKKLNELNEKLLDTLNKTGKVFLSHTKLNNHFVIRVSISGLKTEERHIKEVWKLLKSKSTKILKS
ncbi:MAG TPA: pyridoxal-dependent decarboxylase [Ignavibacteriaceae bacterium]|nr:pyridoxal-dependent decarboxylase [Ignavibacteriaceae bacterium]